jgi:hypothetical protein
MRALAFGLVAAAITVAIPASAEEFYVGGPGIGVEVGNHHHYRDWDRDRDVRVYHRTDGYDRGERCRTTIIRRDDGSVRRIRRCRD